MQELKPQLDKVPVTLSGKTHQQMQRWVDKALSRSKILAESEGVSPRELASTPSSAATVTARGDHVAQLGQHPTVQCARQDTVSFCCLPKDV